MVSLQDKAIQYSLLCKWQEARAINEAILEENPEDIDSLNRLGFACMQIGDLAKSRAAYMQVLTLDESNPIAAKNLKKLDTLEKSGRTPNGDSVPRVMRFIEEAGKTKTVILINIADKKTLSSLQIGQIAGLTIKRSKIFIQTIDNLYIGMLPHDLGIRLIEFVREGNVYEAYVKEVSEKEVVVFIRECSRCKKFANHPSFPAGGSVKRSKRRATAT